MNTTARRVCRPLMITALAGALIGAPSVAMAATYDDDLHATAKYATSGTGWDGVINGRAAGTNVLTHSGTDFETFCIQYGVPAATSGTFTAISWADSGVAGLSRASDVAARHNDIPGKLTDQRSENAAAQLAIWSFTDAVDFSAVPNADIVARAKVLVAAATAAPAPSGAYNVSVDSQSYDQGGVLRTKVAVTVKDDAGKPASELDVSLTPEGTKLDGKSELTGQTTAAGVVEFDFTAPTSDAAGTVAIFPELVRGTVWQPENDLQLVVSAASVEGQIVMGEDIDLVTDVIPAPVVAPEPPVAEPVVVPEAAPVAAPVAEPVAAPVAEAKPAELPHTGALGTVAAFLALLGLGGGAAVIARRSRARA